MTKTKIRDRDYKAYDVNAVRDLRRGQGLSGHAMAHIMGIPVGTYYKKEIGDVKWTLSEAKYLLKNRLARLFGKTMAVCEKSFPIFLYRSWATI